MRISLMYNEKAICDTSLHVENSSNGKIDKCSHCVFIPFCKSCGLEWITLKVAA